MAHKGTPPNAKKNQNWPPSRTETIPKKGSGTWSWDDAPAGGRSAAEKKADMRRAGLLSSR